jgi:hypothetical protein
VAVARNSSRLRDPDDATTAFAAYARGLKVEIIVGRTRRVTTSGTGVAFRSGQPTGS